MIPLSISGPWPNACCLFLSYWCLHECCAYWCNSCSLQCNFPGSFRPSCKFGCFFFVCIDYYKTTCYQLLAEFYLYNVICSWFLWSTANVFFVCLMFALKFLSCNCYLSRTFFSLKQVWWITFWWITHLLMIMLDPGYQNRGLLDSWYEFMIHGSPYLFGWWIGNWVRS